MEKKVYAYCCHCNDDQMFITDERVETLRVKGHDVTCETQTIVCPACGHVRDAPGFDSMAAFYRKYNEIYGDQS